MAELVLGGIIGVVFAELYKAAQELAKSMKFQPILGDVTSTLNSLKPMIEEMVDLNMGLKLSSEAVDKLQYEILKGLLLIQKCSKCHKLNIPKRIKYNKKLHKLAAFLKSLLEALGVEGIRDNKLNLLLTTEISKKVDEMANDVKEILLGTEKHGGLLDELLQDQKEGLQLVRKSSDQFDQFAKQDKQFRDVVLRKMVITKPSKESFMFDRNKFKASSLPVGLNEPLKVLKTKLLKEGVSMLVLTGPQGSGKTTLAKQFRKDEEIKGTFKKNIFFVFVSKKPSLEQIIQQLNAKYKSELPENINDQASALNWLENFLKEAGRSPLLLVLDNVWHGLEFILEKFEEFKTSNCKILVTSIYEFPRFTFRYYLEPLNDDDAMTLLQHSAYKDENSCYSEDHARQIIELCRGFPLAIEMVGKSVCNQLIESWDARVSNWYEHSSFVDSDTYFGPAVQSSIDALYKKKATVQDCFMDLGSFPENKRIPVAALIDIWAVLYKLEEKTSIENLKELTNQSLLANHITMKEEMDVNCNNSEHFVTLHYMLRQLAIYKTRQDPIGNRLIIDICRNNLPKWLIDQKYQPIQAHLLSVSTDEMFSQELPNMQLPEVEVLLLNFQTKNYALPRFVENLKNLQVLIVSNYGSLPAELRKFHLLEELSYLKRIRLQNISISPIRDILLALKNLEKIALFMCSINEALNSNRIRIPYPLPNLVEMSIDCCNDFMSLPDIIYRLTSLKKLSITNCDKLSTLRGSSQGIGKLVKLELLRLKSCKDLLKLPESIGNLKMLKFLDISECSNLKKLPEHIGELSSLRKLNIRRCKGLEMLPQSILQLEELQEVICDEVTEKLWHPFLAKLSIKVTIKEEMST